MGKGSKPANHIYEMVHSERARFMMALVPAAMIVIDEKGIIQAFSKAAEEMFGYAEGETIGRNVSMLMASPHAARHDDYLKRFAETGEKRIMGGPRLEHARTRGGSLFPIELTIGELVIEGDRCFVGFIRALSQAETSRREMRTMLAELAHTSRISAMGALATAIAHELNQPLTTIANYAEGLGTLIARDETIADRAEYLRILENCKRQAIRGGQLLHRLREFVKGGEPHREPVEVQTLVNEAISLALINGYKRAVQIETDLPDDLPSLFVDPLQAQQVLFNLIRNAFEAMDAEDGGHHAMDIFARVDGGGFVELVVEDSGPGIDPDIADSVFDSFVTTKGGGMGVGLAICRQIVESYHGRIWVGPATRLGGAAFHFTLPVAASGQTNPGGTNT